MSEDCAHKEGGDGFEHSTDCVSKSNNNNNSMDIGEICLGIEYSPAVSFGNHTAWQILNKIR